MKGLSTCNIVTSTLKSVLMVDILGTKVIKSLPWMLSFCWWKPSYLILSKENSSFGSSVEAAYQDTANTACEMCWDLRLDNMQS